MTRPRQRKRSARGRFWISATTFLLLLAVWWVLLTFVFAALFEDFLYRVTHPFDSGWAKGPWGFLFLYLLLSLPVPWLHPRFERWVLGGGSRR